MATEVKYSPHSNNSDDITVRCIINGFIITFRELSRTREVFFSTLEELNIFLADYYKVRS
jgi:hypothetical protein